MRFLSLILAFALATAAHAQNAVSFSTPITVDFEGTTYAYKNVENQNNVDVWIFQPTDAAKIKTHTFTILRYHKTGAPHDFAGGTLAVVNQVKGDILYASQSETAPVVVFVYKTEAKSSGPNPEKPGESIETIAHRFDVNLWKFEKGPTDKVVANGFSWNFESGTEALKFIRDQLKPITERFEKGSIILPP